MVQYVLFYKKQVIQFSGNILSKKIKNDISMCGIYLLTAGRTSCKRWAFAFRLHYIISLEAYNVM